jgi:DNA-binding response OmpR family regulator
VRTTRERYIQLSYENHAVWTVLSLIISSRRRFFHEEDIVKIGDDIDESREHNIINVQTNLLRRQIRT